MSVRLPITILTFLAMAQACKESAGPPTEPFPPSGPRPIVTVTLGFAESPLEGHVRVTPVEGTQFWRYAVDVDEDSVVDHSDVLVGEVEFPFRFSAPGVHEVRVDLTGPDGTEAITMPVVVNDPSAIQVLIQRSLQNTGIDFPEGIAVNRAGTELFVSGHRQDELLRLDPVLLAPRGPALSLKEGFGGETSVDWWAEGMSITPSDTLLLVAHNFLGISVVAIPSMEKRRSLHMGSDRHTGTFFFVEALGEATALTRNSRTSTLDLFDTGTGGVIRSLDVPEVWHFAVSPSGDRVAVIEDTGSPALRIATLPDLQQLRRISLPSGIRPSVVAFHPAGDRAYVMGTGRDALAVFLLVDVIAGRVLGTMTLGHVGCLGFCAANPVATLPSGRFVAMEQGSGVFLVDTALDLPRFFTPLGNSVAASEREEAFYVLRSGGYADGLLVSKIAIRP